MNKNKRDFLFRHVPENIRNRILIDDEGIYSTTDQVTANKITKEISKFIPRESIITDATACIGGSTYSFSKFFNKVNAIEIHDTRYEYLVKNIELLQCNNVNCIKGNAMEECLKLKQDIIFIDPPWGGPEYKKLPSVDLFISSIPFHEACILLSTVSKYIVIKVPINFNEETFMKNVRQKLKLIYKNTNLRKMHLLILYTINHNTLHILDCKNCSDKII